MLKTILNAWNIKDIRTRMLFTLLLIVIYRLGSFIPVPFVDASSIAEMAGKYDILGFLNLLSGGSFSQFTIFAMGISPYITGSIVIQLLTIAIPSLERMAKEEDGRQKIEKITRYTGIGLALVQSIGIVVGMGEGVVTSTAWYVYATIGIVCTAGTAFLVWMGERITEKGVGNGVSMIIFASICSQVPRVVVDMFSGVFVQAIMPGGSSRYADIRPGDHHRRGAGRPGGPADPRPVRQAGGGPENVRRPGYPHPHEGQRQWRYAFDLCHYPDAGAQHDPAVLAQ